MLLHVFYVRFLQIGSYFGSEITPVDIDADGVTDHLLVAAPMYFGGGWERGKVYIYRMTEQVGAGMKGGVRLGLGYRNDMETYLKFK